MRSSIPTKRRIVGVCVNLGVLGRDSTRTGSLSLIDAFSSSFNRSPKSRRALNVGLFSNGSGAGVAGRSQAIS